VKQDSCARRDHMGVIAKELQPLSTSGQ
jgi:hypothetical protein